LNLTVHDIDPNFPREVWHDHWENVKRQSTYILESCHRTKDGNTFPVEISVNYIEFDGVGYNCAFARNISERKQAEEALRDSEERYRILFEQTPDAIFLDNQQDETVDVNPAACNLMGYSRDELLQKTVADRQAPEVRGSIGKIVKSETEKYGCRTFEGLNIRKDGTRIPVEIRTVPLTKKGLILSIVRDITNRKRAEAAKRDLDAQLQQIQKIEAIATLAGGIAHRFNNNLSVIAGNLELIRMDFPENENVNEYINPMRSSIQHLAQLTGQLLAYARGGKYKARTISEARPEMKIILCSGYALEGPVQEILNAGAQAFIQKPFSLKALADTLKNA
jgi:PAS domain S-box-containing protein